MGRRRDREEDLEIPASDWKDDWWVDIPDQPPPEFDPDAELLLASSDLRAEDRDRIVKEARGRLARGETREVVSDWLWRALARAAFRFHGFEGQDENGHLILPPHVVEARKYLARKSGAKRQDKRNSDFDKVIARCRELAAEGYDAYDIARECYVAIGGKRQRRSGVSYASFQPRLRGLPRIFGRDGKSPPA
jgi:hypothetical protein